MNEDSGMRNEIIDYFLKLHAGDYSFFAYLCDKLSHERLWQEVPDGVPIANILCHVAEMETFWIDRGLCGLEFERDRQIEFDRRGDLSPQELADRLATRCGLTEKRLEELTDDQWTAEREFHGSPFTGQGILTWHVRHVGLHRGHVQSHARWVVSDNPG
jgi:uncharacterized damage-inducible protein DinB